MHGAWLEQNLKWEKAPKTIDPNLRSAGARLIFFSKDGRVLIWSGIVYEHHKKNPVMSNGDGESLYLGRWMITKAQSTIEYQVVYRTIQIVGEKLPGPIKRQSILIKPNEISIDGYRYRRAEALDKRAVSELQEASGWLQHRGGDFQ